MGCPICDHGISHIMYMGYPMGCTNISMACLVTSVAHVSAALGMDILWDIPDLIVGHPIPLYRTSYGTSLGISYMTPQPQHLFCSCPFSRFSASLRRRVSSFSGPQASFFSYLQPPRLYISAEGIDHTSTAIRSPQTACFPSRCQACNLRLPHPIFSPSCTMEWWDVCCPPCSMV